MMILMQIWTIKNDEDSGTDYEQEAISINSISRAK